MNKVFATMLAVTMLVSSTFAFAEDVYATKNGKRYHKADCLLVKDKGAKVITMEEAQKKALKPCGRCFGEASAKKSKNPDLIAKADTSSAAPVVAETTK
jgi:hypothetical protein